MLQIIEADEAGARFSELMATIAAGKGVIIVMDGEPVARLVPEAAFHAMEEEPEPDGLTPEEREAREVMSAFAAMMNDSF